jgi:hypothetical protein
MEEGEEIREGEARIGLFGGSYIRIHFLLFGFAFLFLFPLSLLFLLHTKRRSGTRARQGVFRFSSVGHTGEEKGKEGKGLRQEIPRIRTTTM